MSAAAKEFAVSIGGKHPAKITKTWHGSFERFCELMLKDVPRTSDKASVGWACGAVFEVATVTDKHGKTWTGPYRDSENFAARHLLSLDYDHIAPEDLPRILEHFKPQAHLAYTTWSHTAENPRLRVWLPLDRQATYDEFQAVSRKVAADVPGGIELAARESHIPCQFMYRAATKPGSQFGHWENTEGPWIDVDEVLASYENWTDRAQWPHRAEGDGVHSEGTSVDPRTKPGLIGAFCRAFSISDAIE